MSEVVQEVTENAVEGVEINDPKAVLAALERAKADAKKFREEKDALQATLDSMKQEVEGLRATREEAAGSAKEKLIEAHIELEMMKRGLGTHGERVRKFLSRDGISLDDDFKPVGVSQAFDSLSADLPELFDPKRRVGGGGDLFTAPEPKVAMSTTELQLQRLKNNN